MSRLGKLSRAQQAVGRLAADAVKSFWASYSHLPPELFRDALMEFMPALVDDYGAVAASAAADWYEQARAAELGGVFTARVEQANLEAVHGSVRWAAGDLFGDDASPEQAKRKLLAAVDRNVRNTARETVVANARRDPAHPRWARVMKGRETCGWCRMLASRGFVYGSRDTAGGDHSWGHDLCDCEAVPEFAMPAQERAAYDDELDELRAQYSDVLTHLDTDSPTDDEIATEWSRSLVDYDAVRGQLAKTRTGMTLDKSLHQGTWDSHRATLLELLEHDYPDGYVGMKRLIPRHPAQAPADWPDDLPMLRAKEWNHALYGDNSKGGHLHGYGWVHNRPEFPPHADPAWVQAAAEHVLRTSTPGLAQQRIDGSYKGYPVAVTVSVRRGVSRVTTIYPIV